MHKTVATLWQVMGEATALYFRDAPSYEAWLTPTAWLVMSGEPAAGVNMGLVTGDAAGGGASEGAARRALGEIVGRLRARKVPAMLFLAGQAAAGLAGPAAELGLKPLKSVPLMTHLEDRGSPRPCAYKVEAITTEASLADSHRLASDAFGDPLEVVSRAVGPRVLDAPGTTIFLACDDHRPVSTVTTVRAGPLVGIFNMATPPEAQRRGAAAAVLEHAMAYHRERGARLFYLLANDASKPLYERLGFEAAAEVAIYLEQPAA
jgi:GNAT superfamily N-acetyltransferase